METKKLYIQVDHDSKSNYFYWDEMTIANKFAIEGLTTNFQYEILMVTEEYGCFIPCDISNKYIGFRLKYLHKYGKSDSPIILETTKLIKNENNPHLQKINVKIIQSYQGLSLSFETEELCNEFHIYKVTDREKILVLSSNVCTITTTLLEQQNSYYVEAYKQVNDSLILKAQSEIFICVPNWQNDYQSTSLSVVIPVYNSEQYLSRTVDSVLMSTYRDIEIILVDDESTDSSPKICDWYANRYPQIRVIHNIHGDLCKARNTGMDLAEGKFIAFLDSDDIVHPYMYQRLMKAIADNNSDIAISQVNIVSCSQQDNTYNIEQHCCMFSRIENEFKNNVLIKPYKELLKTNGDPNNIYFCATVNKIVRSSIAKKVKFNENSAWYEDDAYTMSLYSYIDKFVFVDNAYYIWDKRRHILSDSKTITYKKISYYDTWKAWILARGYVLFYGNKQEEVSKIYRNCVMIKLLQKFGNSSPMKPLDKLFAAMIKYYARVGQLPMEDLKNYSDPQYYAKWRTIKYSTIPEYGGYGNIPNELLTEDE